MWRRFPSIREKARSVIRNRCKKSGPVERKMEVDGASISLSARSIMVAQNNDFGCKDVIDSKNREARNNSLEIAFERKRRKTVGSKKMAELRRCVHFSACHKPGGKLFRFSSRTRVRMAHESQVGVPSVSSKGLTKYQDSWLDLAFIDGCRKAFGRVAGWQSPRSWDEGYLGMVEVSHALMRGRSAAEQQAAVLQGFPRVPDWFRRLFPYSDWGAELNARITPLFFEWLVGPCEVDDVKIADKVLRSEVQIKKCRYLETSGCTAMCVNLCKVPTQYFFTSELGMPLYMEPNFEDLSCRMVFGQNPPPLAEDPALQNGCLSSCPTGPKANPCSLLQ